MDDYFNKENEFASIVTQTVSQPSTPIVIPLTSKRSINSLNSTKSPIISPVKIDTSVSTPKRRMELNLANLQKDYNTLERQYTDLLLKNNDLVNDYNRLEIELLYKNGVIDEQLNKVLKYEKASKNMQMEYFKNKELYEKELYYYKELIKELQDKINRLTNELNRYKRQKDASLETQEKYTKLLKDFKVLQSNFELEKNSKLVLIDQIEYLTRENELLLNQDMSKEKNESSLNKLESTSDDNCYQFETSGQLEFESDVGYDESIIHNYNIHAMHELTDEDDDINDTQMLSYLAYDLKDNHSSPIKPGLDESLEISSNFQFPLSAVTSPVNTNTVLNLEKNHQIQFPPSPDPGSKAQKRQSLPVKLRTPPNLDQDSEFILSPLKLAANSSIFFEMDTSITNTKRRYSNSKPNHSRYNSHDILPIKVEFEQVGSNLRSSSVPEKSHPAKFESIDEIPEPTPLSKRSVRNSTFFTLNGYSNSPSNRNSLATTSSSKRSSLIMDHQMTNEMTKQEIMKLKFELQSLKLHNEKLLSYIGFELQKQKTNIRKLSNKQSFNGSDKKIEYSDAKLIEKSKDLLIHKKRVLRSVSINPILSKNYNHSKAGIITKGLLPYSNNLFNKQFEEFISNNDDEDDYGFLNHDDKFSKRIFSNGLHAYLNYTGIDENEILDYENERNIKKYKSQTFMNKNYLSSTEDEAVEEDSEYSQDSQWEDSSSCDISEEDLQLGILNQMKFLIFGSEVSSKCKKKKLNDQLVDDGLKYKFFTITIGIMIIGLKLSYQNNNTLQITN